MRRPSGDAGASLVIVLAFLLGFAVLVPAILGLAQTNVGTTAATRSQADTSYDADWATQTAVNAIRNTSYNNAPGQACFADTGNPGSDTAALQLPATPNTAGQRALVTCEPGPGTGDPSAVKVPINNSNKPGSALLTLSRDAGEDGIFQGSNNTFRIHGRVFSNSTINVHVNSAKLTADAPIYARGACTGKVLGTPTSCNDTTHDDLGEDPFDAAAAAGTAPNPYAQPAVVPPYKPVPGCAGPKQRYTFEPGYYDDAVALSTLTSNSCRDSLLVFKPGTYYFDFHNTGSHVWGISEGFVIGGTPRTSGVGAWNPANYPTSTPPVPAACISPLEEDDPDTGVQFIFGNDSRMAVSGGAKVELCGQYSADKPPIALYGARSGNETLSPAPGLAATAATSAATGSDPVFADPTRVTGTDGATSDAVFTGGGSNGQNQSATVTAQGFAPTTALPPGTVLVSARVRITHRDVAMTGAQSGAVQALSASLTPARAGAAPVASSNTVAPGADTATSPLREDVWDFTTDALKQEVHDHGFSGARIAYTATTRKSMWAAEHVDSVLLDLTYRLPAFRAQNLPGSCVGAVPYTGGSGAACAFLSTTGPGTAFYSQGTTYTPRAAIDVTLNNVSEQVFKFGLVTRTLRFDITGSSTFQEAVIAVPDNSPGYATTVPVAVFLQTYLCPPGATCADPPNPAPFAWKASDHGWVRRVAARVDYKDPSGNPLPPSRVVTVRDWSYRR